MTPSDSEGLRKALEPVDFDHLAEKIVLMFVGEPAEECARLTPALANYLRKTFSSPPAPCEGCGKASKEASYRQSLKDALNHAGAISRRLGIVHHEGNWQANLEAAETEIVKLVSELEGALSSEAALQSPAPAKVEFTEKEKWAMKFAEEHMSIEETDDEVQGLLLGIVKRLLGQGEKE
jgi:hypothetical protein